MAKTLVISKLERWLPWILIITGVIGVLMAAVIMQEKIHLLENPNYKPSCSINPIISCGSIMQSDQSHAFGFPNPFIGLIGFPVLVVSGAVLLAGAKLRRWYWLGLNTGLMLGVIFAHWLAFQSVYNIGALCPYCMVAWVATITAFWYVTLYNIQKGYLVATGKLRVVALFARRHHLDLLVLWLLTITVLILHHFWYYFGKHLPF